MKKNTTPKLKGLTLIKSPHKKIFAGSLLLFFAYITPVFAQLPKYELLAPFPGVKGVVTLESYFTNLYILAIALAIVLAIMVIVVGGIEYMGGESITSKEEGKKKILSALGGLLLLLVGWIILNTINPDLLKVGFKLAPTGAVSAPSPIGGDPTGPSTKWCWSGTLCPVGDPSTDAKCWDSPALCQRDYDSRFASCGSIFGGGCAETVVSATGRYCFGGFWSIGGYLSNPQCFAGLPACEAAKDGLTTNCRPEPAGTYCYRPPGSTAEECSLWFNCVQASAASNGSECVLQAPVVGMSPEEKAARDALIAGGVGINKDPCPTPGGFCSGNCNLDGGACELGTSCPDCSPGGCTDVGGIPGSGISAIIALKTASSASIVVTGGSEGGHCTHGVGKSIVDLRKTSDTDALSLYITRTGRLTGATSRGEPIYTLNGATYVDEGGHWHVTF